LVSTNEIPSGWEIQHLQGLQKFSFDFCEEISENENFDWLLVQFSKIISQLNSITQLNVNKFPTSRNVKLPIPKSVRNLTITYWYTLNVDRNSLTLLQKLCLRGCCIQTQTAEKLFRGNTLSYLTTLDLSENIITTLTGNILEAILPSIQLINLCDNRLVEDVSSCVDLLRKFNLRYLNLSKNMLGENGFQNLMNKFTEAQPPWQQVVTTVTLAHNGIRIYSQTHAMLVDLPVKLLFE
jgi:hypothetical protein